MSAFSTTLSAFCAGNIPLPQLLAVLRDDLQHDRRALFDDTTLIESAWRSGRVDREIYQVLRDTIVGSGEMTAPEAQPYVGAQSWPEIRACRDGQSDMMDPVTCDDPTLFRASTSPAAIATTGANHKLSSAPRSLPGNRQWTTDSPLWSDEPSRDVSPGDVLKDRFVLEEIIGRGGMGTVYKARDIRKEEAQDRYPFVAVKVLNEDFRRHPESFKALQREAKKSQSLAHPNVVSVFDFDRDGAVVFLVMELLEGQSLQELIQNRAGRGLPRTETLRIVRSVGAALAYAHHKGVVHSDFKPANAIRTQDGAIKVLDFGIARAIVRPSHPGAETTQFDVSGLGAVTPAYASYEMLIGEQAHPSDDVFALACVTYELLSGRHPFGYMSALLAERRGLKPVPIEGLSRANWRALSRGLAFSRDERTPSVEAFLDELAPKARAGLVSSLIAAGIAAAGVGAWNYLPAVQSIDTAALWSRLTSWNEAEATAQAIPDAPRPASPAALPSTSAAATAPQPDLTTDAGATTPRPITDQLGIAPSDHDVASVSAPMTISVPSAADETHSSQAQITAEQTPTQATAASLEFSVEQLKQRLTAFARMDEPPDALAVLRELQARLPPDDEFLLHDGPRAIGQAYLRLGERAFVDGNYSAAIALLNRAHEQGPDFPMFATRREQMQQVAQLEQMLEEGPNLSAEIIQSRLREIREAEGVQFGEIRARLAATLARRIEALQKSAPAEANQLLGVGQQSFAGASAIESLAPVDENAGPATGNEHSQSNPDVAAIQTTQAADEKNWLPGTDSNRRPTD